MYLCHREIHGAIMPHMPIVSLRLPADIRQEIGDLVSEVRTTNTLAARMVEDMRTAAVDVGKAAGNASASVPDALTALIKVQNAAAAHQAMAEDARDAINTLVWVATGIGLVWLVSWWLDR